MENISKVLGRIEAALNGSLDGLELDNKDDVIEKDLVIEMVKDLKVLVNEAQEEAKNIPSRFQPPSDKQMIDIAILFNDGKLEKQKLSDMVGYGKFIVDRLYENGDVGKRSSKEMTIDKSH